MCKNKKKKKRVYYYIGASMSKYIYTHTHTRFVRSCVCALMTPAVIFFCLVPERRQTTEFSHPSLKGLSPLLRPCRLMMMTQYKKERKKEKREKNALLLPLDQSLHVAEERGVTECIASFWEGGGKGGWERLHYQ